MTLNSKSRQKKRAKKAEKRKEAKKVKFGIAALFGFAQEWVAAAKAPVADVFVPSNIFEMGIGTVWISRKLPDGRYAVAGFIVDTFCLGVKNVLDKLATADEYERILSRIHSSPEEHFEREHPAYARKLVERAVAYAQNLGFEPHSDYKLAKTLFGDVDANTCPASFTFGHEGKPHYISGPNDSPAFQRRIIRQLEKRCGPNGYHWTISVSEGGGLTAR